MARMIPAIINPCCSSPGEREIFNRLKNDPATGDWIVLHSLDVANHINQVAGEVDFVIIIPSKGVLCLEVKACTRLECVDGLWYYGHNTKPDPRGPFKQVSTAMHSLRNYLVEHEPGLSRVVFWSAVIFPYVPFNVTSGEWHPWQVIDCSSFRAKPTSALVEAVLDKARDYLEQCSSTTWFNALSGEPTLEQCKKIASILRPNFEFIEGRKSLVSKRNEEVKRYTEEQFIALDAMEANPRVAFMGPAGTGKTLLAIESARRGASAGRKVLFLCFNRLLGKWLKEITAEIEPVNTRTLHQHLLKVSGQKLKDGMVYGDEFWKNKLPEYAIEKLVEDETGEYTFDEIIVDEAQDILNPTYLDFLDLSLKGGLATGRWRFFGDFEKQNIYQGNISLDNFIKTRGGQAPVYNLRVNCRNTPRVASMAQLLGRLEPGYKKVLRPDDKIDPCLYYYEDESDQVKLLCKVLDQLYKDNFKGNDIVILSPRVNNSCASIITTSPWKQRIKPYEVAGQGYIGYTTIHSFKGLEAGAVILTDIEHVSSKDASNLFYVALTRALHRLVILASEQVKEEIISIILDK